MLSVARCANIELLLILVYEQAYTYNMKKQLVVEYIVITSKGIGAGLYVCHE